METRKLQQVGGGTYTVSLPKGWVEDYGLSPGDDVHLFVADDGSLVVRAPAQEADRLASVSVSVPVDDADPDPGSGPDPDALDRLLRAAYVAGFDRTVLDVTGPAGDATRRAVRTATRDLVGADVEGVAGVRAGRGDGAGASAGASAGAGAGAGSGGGDRGIDGPVAVRNRLGGGDVAVQQSVLQLRFVCLSMHRTATAVLVGEEPATARERVADRGRELTRLGATVARHCNRSLVSYGATDALDVDRVRLFDCYRVARRLEAVADEARRIVDVLDGADDLPDDGTGTEIHSLGHAVRSVVETATDALIEDEGIDAVRECLAARADAADGAAALEERLAGADEHRVAVRRVLDALDRTADHGEAIAEVALESALRDRPGADVGSATDGARGDESTI